VVPKINVYLPDELAEAVKESGVPVSAICQRALEQAVRRVTAIRETVLGGLDDADLATRLPHFTPRARLAVKLGIDQAGADSSPAVGTGHLLAGMITEGGNLALRVLQALEIDAEQLARELARQTLDETAAGAQDGAQHFSDPASNALELAVTEATALGHNYVGCEHLLLGLVSEPDGIAGQVLRSAGAELRLTRRAVAAALAGYVHLRAQTGQPGAAGQPGAPGAAGQPGAGTAPPAAGGGNPMAALLTAVRQELQPLITRIERLEERTGAAHEE
jgi:ATP-dependent Clp protease ATP-binding subunit ClpC